VYNLVVVGGSFLNYMFFEKVTNYFLNVIVRSPLTTFESLWLRKKHSGKCDPFMGRIFLDIFRC